ncbi:MAG: hypothetical protein KQH59_21200 [Desulfobulbaceae bacterium]|nr:hypothetical protein [Desulfobulbaceae bacterium]
MKTIQRIKMFIVVYILALIALAIIMITLPILIQQGLPVTESFVIEEEILEASLIAVLLWVSYCILSGFIRELNRYARELEKTSVERSRLLSRLSDSFSYIGVVNVELQTIQSIFCGIDRYPQTKKEFKRLINDLVAKVMTVAGTPRAVICLISRDSGRTIAEYSSVRAKKSLPSVIIGNREILENRHVEGVQEIHSSPKNLDLITVCLVPATRLPKEAAILVTAITNQVELFFMLHRAGLPDKLVANGHADKHTGA